MNQIKIKCIKGVHVAVDGEAPKIFIAGEEYTMFAYEVRKLQNAMGDEYAAHFQEV